MRESEGGLRVRKTMTEPDSVLLATAKPVAEQPKRAGGSRAGPVQIQGYFPQETRRQLKMLVARMDLTVEELFREAIADVMARYAAAKN